MLPVGLPHGGRMFGEETVEIHVHRLAGPLGYGVAKIRRMA